MADQDPSNLNNDKFTLTLSDGVTRPPNIFGSPQIPENQTITQTSPNLPTLSHTQEINAEAALSSLSTTPDDTVTSQDTVLITPSLAHDATEPSMTPPTDSTLDSDGAAMSADSNHASKDLSQLPTPEAIPADTQQNVSRPTASTLDSDGAAMSADSNHASKDLSQLPTPEAIPADTQQNVSRPTASILDSDGAVMTADSNQASNDLSQLPTPEAIPADTQQTGGGNGKKKRRRRQRKHPKESIQSDGDSMEAFGDIHQGQTYELENANDNISDLTQTPTKAEIETVTLNQEPEKGNTESANIEQQIETSVNEKASLTEELASLIDELAKGKTEIRTLEEKLENAEHKIRKDDWDKMVEIADWEKKLKVEGTMITGLRNDITILRREVNSRTTDLIKAKQARDNKEFQNNHLSHELNGCQTENKRLMQEIGKLNSLNQELDKANQARDNKELQNNHLDHELKGCQTENKRLMQEIGKLNSEKSGLSQELDKAKSEVTNLKQEVESLAAQKSQLDWATDEFADGELRLKEQVSELETVNKGLEQERNKLQNELEREKDQRRAKDIEMETQYATIQEQRQSLETQNVDLTRLAEDLVKKEKDIDHANDANTKLEEKNKTLEHMVSTVSGQVKGSEKALFATRAELKTLKEVHESATKDLTAKVERLTMRVQSQKKDKVNEMKREFAETLEANGQMEIEIDMLRTQVSGLEEQLLLFKGRYERTVVKFKQFRRQTNAEDAEAAEENAGEAGEKEATAGEKAGEQAATAGEKADTIGEKADAPHEKADAAKEKAGTAGEHAERAEETIKTPHENKVEHQESVGDVPAAEQLAVAMSHEPAVDVIEEPKLPSAEVEAKGQGSKTGLFEHTEAEPAELTRPQQGNGNSSGTTEAETVINANALAKAEPPHKQIPQAGDPFTEAHVSLEAPAKLFDPDYDVSDSDSSVGSTTELSTDNQTPRALRRPLGQEGIHSRRHSTATDLSVTQVEKWFNRVSKYVEKDTQTDNVVLVEDMGVQKENAPVEKPMILMDDMGVQTESAPVEKAPVENAPVENAPVEKPMVLMEDMGVQTENAPVENAPVENPMVLMEDMGVQTEVEIPKFRQTRRYLLMSSFIHLLMLLFYLGMFYLAWSSWADTTAERDLWTRTNSALTHRRLLVENGSYPPSAISEIFYRKM